MDIIVCIKQVPNVTEVKWDPVTGSLVRKGVPSIINPCDKSAIEAALKIKEIHGGEVIVLSMGPGQVEEALREALGMGADRAIQLTDKAFAGSDTWVTSYTLALAIRKVGNYDLIICGKEAIDGMTAQVGPEVAEFLGIGQLTYAKGIDVVGNMVKVRQIMGQYHRTLETIMPAMITVERDIHVPRVAPMDKIIDAYGKEIEIWDSAHLKGDYQKFGLKGSPTKLRKVYTPKVLKGKVEMLDGKPELVALRLVEALRVRNLI